MNHSNRKADVHVYDVGRVIGFLREHPHAPLVRKRACEMTGVNHLDSRALYEMAHNQIIDDFVKHAINSFQEIWIMGYDASSNTEPERQWFHLNTLAWQALYEIVRVGPSYAGSMVGYTRINNLIYLYVPTT